MCTPVCTPSRLVDRSLQHPRRLPHAPSSQNRLQVVTTTLTSIFSDWFGLTLNFLQLESQECVSFASDFFHSQCLRESAIVLRISVAYSVSL